MNQEAAASQARPPALHEVRCPLCGGSPDGPAFPFSTQWNGRRFDYVGCGACGSAFVTPLPDAGDLARMYDPAVYHDIHYAGEEIGPELRHTIATLCRQAPPPRSLLDFGCGAGVFLRLAADAGYASHGVEQNCGAIDSAAARTDLPVSTIEEVESSGARFDIIHLADVLEHLPDPAATLRRLEALLSPTGQFLIRGPLERQTSLVFLASSTVKKARRLVGRDREGSHPPYHLTLTSWASQRHFFGAVMGYEVTSHDLVETGWPLLGGGRVHDLIGGLAVRASRTLPGRRLGLANRFTAFLRPQAGKS